MVEVINSSFIPKKDLSRKKRRSSGGGSIDVFLLIAIIIFFAAIVASVGVYLWSQQVKEENISLLQNIEENKNAYSLETLDGLIDLDQRIKISSEILQKHYNVMPIFLFLQEKTLSRVVLENFKLKIDTENSNSFSVEAKGFADDFDTIAVQSEQYSSDKRVENLILDSYDRDQDGEAIFDLSFSWSKDNLIE